MDFEREILNGLNAGIQKAIETQLSGYNSPLVQMIAEVMEKNHQSIVDKMNSAFSYALKNPYFETTLKTEFNRKVAKSLLSGLEGTVEKAAAAFKQDPTIRSKMILAIQAIIEKSDEKETP
jgi:predicted nucleotide-binding protein (sugar kinase/HSP70/actin superfamily)